MGCGRGIEASDGEQTTAWYPVDRLPNLAYDHENIIKYARERLAAKLTYTNAAMGLLEKKFTLSHLQTAYEAVMGRELDKRNFRKSSEPRLIHETPDTWRDGAHRPAKLYAFNTESLEVLSRSRIDKLWSAKEFYSGSAHPFFPLYLSLLRSATRSASINQETRL